MSSVEFLVMNSISLELYGFSCNKIIIESCGGSGDNDAEKEDKIIKNITKVTTID